MSFEFKFATSLDASIIAGFVCELTHEICCLTNSAHFDLDAEETRNRCEGLMEQGHYAAIIAYCDAKPIAVVTFTETFALYAGGKIGLIQECYVQPQYRTLGIGSQLLVEIKKHGQRQHWACIELCTPPLPAFEATLAFYESNGLKPVGGRKMRENLLP